MLARTDTSKGFGEIRPTDLNLTMDSTIIPLVCHCQCTIVMRKFLTVIWMNLPLVLMGNAPLVTSLS